MSYHFFVVDFFLDRFLFGFFLGFSSSSFSSSFFPKIHSSIPNSPPPLSGSSHPIEKQLIPDSLVKADRRTRNLSHAPFGWVLKNPPRLQHFTSFYVKFSVSSSVRVFSFCSSILLRIRMVPLGRHASIRGSYPHYDVPPEAPPI